MYLVALFLTSRELDNSCARRKIASSVAYTSWANLILSDSFNAFRYVFFQDEDPAMMYSSQRSNRWHPDRQEAVESNPTGSFDTARRRSSNPSFLWGKQAR